MKEPWERKLHETSKAYEAFCIYRDLGITRNQTKVVQKLGKSKALVEKWSRKFNWVERAQRWDDHIEEQRRKQFEKDLLDMLERHAALSVLIQSKGVQKFESINLETEMTVKEALKAVTEGVRIERLTRGQTTQETEGTGKMGADVQIAGTVWYQNPTVKKISHSIPLSLSFLSSSSRILQASRDSFFSLSLRNSSHSSSFAPFLTQSVKGVEESTSFFFKTLPLLWSTQFYSLAFELYNRSSSSSLLVE